MEQDPILNGHATHRNKRLEEIDAELKRRLEVSAQSRGGVVMRSWPNRFCYQFCGPIYRMSLNSEPNAMWQRTAEAISLFGLVLIIQGTFLWSGVLLSLLSGLYMFVSVCMEEVIGEAKIRWRAEARVRNTDTKALEREREEIVNTALGERV